MTSRALDNLGLLTPQASAADRAALLDAVQFGARCFGGGTVGGWTLAWTITLPLAGAAVLYGIGVTRLWSRAGVGRAVMRLQLCAFIAGWLVLALALLSPIHEASRGIFAAHMIEHELVMVVAAPLLVLARPLPLFLWGLPKSYRKPIGGLLHGMGRGLGRSGLTDPLPATLLHGLAIWLWHVPFLFRAALVTEWLHWLQHFTFLSTGLIFWWALLGRASRRSGSSIVHLFATSLHTGLLGVLLFLTPQLWFGEQSREAASWGLTALEDQQLAGLIMWVPAGVIYAGAALALAALWIVESGKSALYHADALPTR
ncbi:cytochrome c oxidase assembly protein [Mesorhizobium sp. BR1-1-16]|uniref:cytochrome c oxidase assembly protein n=1 Tax=Mesorhizobium sp. BR1-1-16 TaxID=2876653 RepID=UPI001CC9A87D|nr:cytochrome c oxidase assembly protein [Mesorhizobium sp. BR1-1-16]MBZ9936986.1 cytochrome c oxidase assembly protein [Mesorhizobium sp. BR1-1-16]